VIWKGRKVEGGKSRIGEDGGAGKLFSITVEKKT
jgi:hypothetical protein